MTDGVKKNRDKAFAELYCRIVDFDACEAKVEDIDKLAKEVCIKHFGRSIAGYKRFLFYFTDIADCLYCIRTSKALIDGYLEEISG